MKHTQGDWRVIKKAQRIGYADYEIAYSDDGELICDIVYSEADARLIAAAPNLLDALKGILGAWNMVCDANGWERDHIQQQKDAVAAIAKATGEQP